MGAFDVQTISEQVSELRKQKGMTQEQLAARLGVSSQAVSKWENGQSYPDIVLLPLLCDVFQISVDELFGRNGGSTPIKQGLVAEYLFNGDARDYSGQNRHGKVVGAIPCEDRFGRANRAYYFDGKDDYMIIDPAPPLQQDAFSLSVWCWYDPDSNTEGWTNAIVSQDDSNHKRALQLSTFDTQITFHRFLSEPDLRVAAPIHKQWWYHLVVTYDGQHCRLYKNGNLEQEQEGVFTPAPDEPLYIGRKASDEPYFFFHGKIDDLRIYDRVLADGEIRSLWLEQGWNPPGEPAAPVMQAEDWPVLECVDHVQMLIREEHIDEAAAWYKQKLGFKPLIEQKHQFYMLSLYKGATLLLHGTPQTPPAPEIVPFVFKTKQPIDLLSQRLASAGATVQDVREKVFATFMTFRDPFGYMWTVIREKQ